MRRMGDITEYMTVQQAADELGVSKPRIWQIIKEGKRLKVETTIGKLRLLKRSDVMAAKAFIRRKAGRPPNTKPPDPPAKKPRKGKK